MRDLRGIWGCGKGYARRLQPPTRIACGIVLIMTSLVVPLDSPFGIAVILAAACGWCLLSGMPRKMALGCAAAATVLFAPYMVLTPWMSVESGGFGGKFLHAGTIALRSGGCLFVAASTVSVLSLAELHRGVAGLPLPRSVAALVTQLVNQTMLLIEETGRIVSVLRLRGASGWRGISVLFAFPVVWMVRMVSRAERTAMAMSARGYGIESAVSRERVTLASADWVCLTASLLLFSISLIMRIRI